MPTCRALPTYLETRVFPGALACCRYVRVALRSVTGQHPLPDIYAHLHVGQGRIRMELPSHWRLSWRAFRRCHMEAWPRRVNNYCGKPQILILPSADAVSHVIDAYSPEAPPARLRYPNRHDCLPVLSHVGRHDHLADRYRVKLLGALLRHIPNRGRYESTHGYVVESMDAEQMNGPGLPDQAYGPDSHGPAGCVVEAG